MAERHGLRSRLFGCVRAATVRPPRRDASDHVNLFRVLLEGRVIAQEELIYDFRSAAVIVQTASIISSSRTELDGFRDLLAEGRRFIDGARSCIDQSIAALSFVK